MHVCVSYTLRVILDSNIYDCLVSDIQVTILILTWIQELSFLPEFSWFIVFIGYNAETGIDSPLSYPYLLAIYDNFFVSFNRN